MLVLSRQRDEEVVVVVPPSTEPTIITHTTVDIRGDRVRHGYNAASGVQIHRREIFDAIQRENRAKAISATPKVNP